MRSRAGSVFRGLLALAAPGWFGLEMVAAAADTSALPSAQSVLSRPVGSVLVQPDGKIVISGGGHIWFSTRETGTFGCLNGTVARFHPDGTLDYKFGCRADLPNYVSVFDTHLAGLPDGRLLMAGIFHSVDGQPRSRLALLSADGKLDPNFIPWREGTNALAVARPYHPAHLRPAALDPSNRIVFPGIKRSPPAGGFRVFEMDDAGRVVGPRFPDWATSKFAAEYLTRLSERGLWLYRPVNWAQSERTEWSKSPQERRFIWEFFQAGDPLSAGDAAEVLKVIFAELPLELCRNAVRLPDGSAILLVQDGDTGRFMHFDTNWLADLTYTNTLRARGYLSLAVQPDGKLLVARGSELHDLATGKGVDVVRVNADGTVDRSFRCETDERVMALAVQPDGKILIGGFFLHVNGVYAPFLARLYPNGSVDQVFQGRFTNIAGVMAHRRLPVTSLAAASSPGVPPSSTSPTAPPLTPGASEVAAISIRITTMTLENGTAVLQFQGTPNQVFILQATESLGSGQWFNVHTNRTDAQGNGALRDPGAKDSAIRFYRVAAP